MKKVTLTLTLVAQCLDEEGIVGVAGRVALRLEQRVEVPEARLHPAVRGHLLEPHPHENASELGSHFEERVEVAPSHRGAVSLKVVRLQKTKDKIKADHTAPKKRGKRKKRANKK